MNYRKKAIHTLRVNIKSLSYESKIIREEIKKAHKHYKDDLYVHRVWNVRRESRTTQLALAAVKGVPYRKIEKFARSEPNWKRIADKFKKHVGRYHWTPEEELERLGNWLTEAHQYFRKNSLTKSNNLL